MVQCCARVWNQSDCALVYSSACMLMLMMFVCVCAMGVPFPCYSQTICKAGCWSHAEAHGTAGASPWLIKVAARTSSPPEWRQRPHNAQPVCYACLSLSADCGPAPVLSWGSRGAKREVRTQTNYHFMTKRVFCRRYIIDLPFRVRSLWSSFGRVGLKGGGEISFSWSCSQWYKNGLKHMCLQIEIQ